LLNINV